MADTRVICRVRTDAAFAGLLATGRLPEKREEPLVFSVVTVTVETFLAWKQWKRFCESQLLFNRNSYL
jgi:hypothetical protein